jgi:hypothetical protein
MSAPTTPPEDETMRWFDEEFASAIKLAREPSEISFETFLDKLEHRDLIASARRNRSAIDREEPDSSVGLKLS